MNSDGPSAGFAQATGPLSALAQHLEAAEESHTALVEVVGQLPAMTVHELALGLGVSRDCAASLARGEGFDNFLTRNTTPRAPNQNPDWSIAWTER